MLRTIDGVRRPRPAQRAPFHCRAAWQTTPALAPCPRRPTLPARPSSAPKPSSIQVPDATPATRQAFLSVKGAAEYLGLSPHTLYVWRHRRNGPPSFRMGPRGRVMYRIEALDAWIREQEQADSRSNTTLSPLGAAPQRRSDYATGA
ncbi:helix-turn-helix transcriptional regulator [Streptomyces sp. NBC_00989]|uniref:helix-turn-helix transcriptional regulator n=1 Tax=Streptomyces sp. NBC_00989 TaxID=2903705 RepID=UPI00386BD52C|nr:helix-turn-helix domain-containing protein [Streptomyces sp. NBC_00989]